MGRIFSESHACKELVGDSVLLLHKAEDGVALSLQGPGHAADQGFGVAPPSVLRQRIQHPHGTTRIRQDPGHRPPLGIQHAARREMGNHVTDHSQGPRMLSELPGLIYQVKVGLAEGAQGEPRGEP